MRMLKTLEPELDPKMLLVGVENNPNPWLVFENNPLVVLPFALLLEKGFPLAKRPPPLPLLLEKGFPLANRPPSFVFVNEKNEEGYFFYSFCF